jgi:hypothetical protein
MNQRDLIAGVCIIAGSSIALWISRDYNIGTSTDMSSGYVPRLICWLLILGGAILSFNALRASPPIAVPWGIRALTFIVLALVCFALTLDRLGLVAAAIVLVVVCSFAARPINYRNVILTAVGLTCFVSIVFVELLEQPINLWPW